MQFKVKYSYHHQILMQNFIKYFIFTCCAFQNDGLTSFPIKENRFALLKEIHQ